MAIGSSASSVSDTLASVDVVLALYEAIDGGHATEAITLFTEDAVFDHPQKVFRGRDEVQGFLTTRENDKDRHTAHVLNNVRVAETAGGELDVSSAVFIYSPDAEGEWDLHRVVRMRHTVRSEHGQWRIAARVIEPLERAADQEPG